MKITNETRLESYINRPSPRQREILSILERPMSTREVMIALNYHDMNQVRPRMTELLEQGLIEAIEKATDPMTGRKVAVFRRVENV